MTILHEDSIALGTEPLSGFLTLDIRRAAAIVLDLGILHHPWQLGYFTLSGQLDRSKWMLTPGQAQCYAARHRIIRTKEAGVEHCYVIVQQELSQSTSGDAHLYATIVHFQTKSARCFCAHALSLNFVLPYKRLLQTT